MATKTMQPRIRENFAGASQPDLAARAASLMALGAPEPPRNPFHPDLYWRSVVTSMELERGIVWNGRTKQHDQRDENGQCKYFRWQDPAYAR